MWFWLSASAVRKVITAKAAVRIIPALRLISFHAFYLS